MSARGMDAITRAVGEVCDTAQLFGCAASAARAIAEGHEFARWKELGMSNVAAEMLTAHRAQTIRAQIDEERAAFAAMLARRDGM